MEMQKPKYTAGLLEYREIPWAVEVACKRMLTEELGREEEIDLERLYDLVYTSQSRGYAVVARYGDEPVGAVGGLLISQLFYPNKTTFAEMMWYVLPEHRKTRASYLMLKKYMEIVDNSGASDATFSTLPSSPIKNESLSKMGFEFVEKGFRKQLGV